ncbi:MAG: metallopeptidase family protein [Planctomycetota bacterium]
MIHRDESVADPAVEAAWNALDHGEPENALTEAGRVGDPGQRAELEAHAYLALGLLDAASGAIERVREQYGDEDVVTCELDGELALARWELGSALEAFTALAEVERDSRTWQRLALLHDHMGRHDRAHQLLVEASGFDPDHPAPIRVPEATFDGVVERALASLRPEFARRLENVRIVREPVPFQELRGREHIDVVHPDLLGLFVGPTIHDLSEDASGELPPTIYLFQRNLERMVASEEELAEEIRVTLFHEIGHLLGLDEDEVASMGLA